MRMTAEQRAAVADAAWAVAERLGTFSYSDVAAAAHISKDIAKGHIRKWVAEGACQMISEGGRGKGQPHMFRALARRTRAVRTVHPTQNVWNAMRGLRSFTPTDLAAHATTEDVTVTTEAARAYCQALLRAEYLKVERKAIPGRREAIYRLIRNTGPRPPRERRVRAVVDDNLGQIVHVEGRDDA